jgi:hypothetical protein
MDNLSITKAFHCWATAMEKELKSVNADFLKNLHYIQKQFKKLC